MFLPMFFKARKKQKESQPRVPVVYGSKFDGTPYTIALQDDEVGLGSSARILKGSILGTNYIVAVKVFGDLLSREKQHLLSRELHFAREVASCHHYILPFLGTAILGEQTALVSLYIKNGNLMEYINLNPECNKKQLILQVAEAVRFLHVEKRLVHGDLKCENVLVSDNGKALLADFGLSSFVEKSETLSTTMTAIRKMHTAQFAAPELLGIPEEAGQSRTSLSDDNPPVAKKTTESDVFAFGMLILQAISEKPPWGFKSEFAVIKSLSVGQRPQRPTLDGTFVAMSHSWWDVCQSCWCSRPRERPGIADVLRTLKAPKPLPYRELPLQDCTGFATYTPDRTAVVLTPCKGSRMLFDIATDSIRDLATPLDSGARRPAVSPDGREIAWIFAEEIRVLDAASGTPVTSIQPDGTPTCVAYSWDGTRIASGSSTGAVQVWDAGTGAAVGEHLNGHTEFINDISFSPDGSCVALASDDGTIRLWDTGRRSPTAILLRPELKCWVSSIKFSPDGLYIAAGYDDDLVIIWDVLKGHVAHTFDNELGGPFDVAFPPSGIYVATGSVSGDIRIWDLQEWNQFGAPLRGGNGRVSSVSFSRDGKSLVSTAMDGKVRIWDLFD